MKINKILLFTLSALLCLPGCWCSKKRCAKKCNNECKQELVAADLKQMQNTEVAIKDTIDAFDPNVIVLEEELTVASRESTKENSKKSLVKF